VITKEEENEQEEFKNQFMTEVIQQIDSYMGSLPLEDNFHLTDSNFEKQEIAQEIISYYYNKYYKKIKNIQDFDIRFELTPFGLYSLLFFEKGKLLKENIEE